MGTFCGFTAARPADHRGRRLPRPPGLRSRAPLMCGIAGILTPGRPVGTEILERMVTAMTHRGPDDRHSWCSKDIALGMRRLAIVDVAGGAQPLRNETGTVHVIFNGEIYNHENLRRE